MRLSLNNFKGDAFDYGPRRDTPGFPSFEDREKPYPHGTLPPMAMPFRNLGHQAVDPLNPASFALARGTQRRTIHQQLPQDFPKKS